MRLRRIEPHLRRAFRGPCRVPPGSRILVAVSGGADSIALLSALMNLAHEWPVTLAAAHLDHGLRGAAARGDAAFVRERCEALGVPLFAAAIDARARMKREDLSGEAGLRTLRRRFLLAAMRRAGAVAIATAHTADDQLETLLMRLVRGAGLAGLAGMAPRRGVWLKPLLLATRLEIVRDLEQAALAWREDASNATREHLRNRVRLDVVPALVAAGEPRAALRHRARAGLARRAAAAASEAREASRWLLRRVMRAEKLLAGGAGDSALEVAGLARCPALVQRALLQRCWRRSAPGRGALTTRHFEALQRLVGASGRRGAVALPGAWRARVSGGALAFVAPAQAAARARTLPGLHRPQGAADVRLRETASSTLRASARGVSKAVRSSVQRSRTPRRTRTMRVRSGAS